MTRVNLSASGLAARAAAIAAAGLLLAACHSSSSGTASGGPSGSTSSSPTSGSHSSSSAAGGSGGTDGALFPATVGDIWTYRDTSGGTTINKVTAVTPDSDGKKVTIATNLNQAGVASPTTDLTYQLYSNGSIGVPYADTGNQHVIIKSGGIVWPSKAVLDSGQPHTSPLTLQITVAGHALNITAHVTVQGMGTQSVTVPAGTYQATVVSETIAETVSGTKFNVVVKTWLAPGVGPVKSEVNTGEGTAINEVLTSFKQG